MNLKINTNRVLLVVFIFLLAMAYIIPVNAGGNGRPDRPAPIVPTRNPHYVEPSPIGEQEVVPTSTPGWRDVPPPCGYTNDVLCDGVELPLPEPTRENPFPIQPITREPLLPPIQAEPDQDTNIQPCYPVTDDVALLIEAVSEGYSIIIVKDVLGTSPGVIVINNE